MLGNVGDGVLDVPFNGVLDVLRESPIVLSEYGKITEKHIIALNEYYEHISIQNYVIMPNHVHILLAVLNEHEKDDKTSRTPLNGTSRTPSPTNAVVPAFVSTLKRFIHKECGFSLFQRAYHDRIIRNEDEYMSVWKYIDENPVKYEKYPEIRE
ncbi:MAG: hypothetical protein FWG70_04960 [Oscillospiraceae bacterium]|nr:hypothetical protein [Oscillospiraceae bacterium]